MRDRGGGRGWEGDSDCADGSDMRLYISRGGWEGGWEGGREGGREGGEGEPFTRSATPRPLHVVPRPSAEN